ncbi:MAG: six-hairpin glycosidase [Flavitalea sp.]
MKIYIYGLCLAMIATASSAQTGSIHEPVRYIGGQTIDPSVHEGRLRYAIGTENIQTMRANRTHPASADGYGWTYNHGSNICYWKGKFFQQYLSNPVDEHIAPGQTLLVTSADGRHWNKPELIFPPYTPPAGVKIPEGYTGYMMHQRMGFYISPDGRLLTLAFYGHTEDPFGKGGIGRVVREVYADGSFGPIYFIRYDSETGWNSTNTSYPFYNTSADAGFVKACNALLDNALMTFQWYEEDAGADGFYKGKEGKQAFCWYHRKDGKITGLWKLSYAALSDDEGKTFSTLALAPTLLMSGGKQWGQQTSDGRYAICYNPIENSEYRYPLAIITGDDGIVYDHLLLVQGEVPPRRFSGRWKDFGPCYMRGIEEGNGKPPGKDMWLSYTMNKEDVWIARIPTPVTYSVKGAVSDNFNDMKPDGPIAGWNIYSPAWAPVAIVKAPGKEGQALQLMDKDPYDYSRAIRVFEETKKASLSLKVMADAANSGGLDIDVTDQYGNRPVRIRFNEEGNIVAADGGVERLLQPYKKNTWYTMEVLAEAGLNGRYSLSINGKNVLHNAQMAEAVKTIERLSLRTGPYRNLPTRLTPNETTDPPLAGADEHTAPVIFYVDDVRLQKAL